MIEGESIVYEVAYPHPPERVWRALVDAEELGVWLMPNDFLPVLGRPFTLECPDYRVQAEVLALNPPWRLSWRWVGSFGDTVVTFELAPTQTGTRLRLEHRGWTEATRAHRDGFDAGWPTKLSEYLPAVLAGEPVREAGGREEPSTSRHDG